MREIKTTSMASLQASHLEAGDCGGLRRPVWGDYWTGDSPI